MSSRPVVDTNGTGWKREFFVYVREPGWAGIETLEEFAGTVEEAQAKAKKYIHLGRVRVVEKLERTVEVTEQKGVCT